MEREREEVCEGRDNCCARACVCVNVCVWKSSSWRRVLVEGVAGTMCAARGFGAALSRGSRC